MPYLITLCKFEIGDLSQSAANINQKAIQTSLRLGRFSSARRLLRRLNRLRSACPKNAILTEGLPGLVRSRLQTHHLRRHSRRRTRMNMKERRAAVMYHLSKTSIALYKANFRCRPSRFSVRPHRIMLIAPIRQRLHQPKRTVDKQILLTTACLQLLQGSRTTLLKNTYTIRLIRLAQ